MKQQVIVQEKIPGYQGSEQILNTSKELPQLVGMDSGIYVGPEYPFILYKISARTESIIYINLTYDFKTQDIMNGAWKWRILVPVTGEIEDIGIKVDGNWAICPDSKSERMTIDPLGRVTLWRTYTTTYGDLKYFGLINTTRFGEVLTVTYPIFPEKHTISIYVLIKGDVVFHFVRENSIQTLTTILQSRKIQLNNTVGVAFEFLDGFGDAGMGGIHISKDQILHISIHTDTAELAEEKYLTITFPIYIPNDQTTVHINIKYKNNTLGTQNETANLTLNSGFQYITQSTAHKADAVYDIFLSFDKDVTLLFCAASQDSDVDIVTLNSYDFEKVHYGNLTNPPSTTFSHWIYLSPIGILFDYNFTDDQFAKVLELTNVTIYDFGFATVKQYTNGTFVVTEHGTYTTWKVYKNITIKSLGAKIEEDIFGQGITEGGDILAVILNTLRAGYLFLKKIWDFLLDIGNILWAGLMKFVGWILNAINWLVDAAGSILNYVLYIIIPIAIMFIVSYTARWAKGLRATDKEVEA